MTTNVVSNVRLALAHTVQAIRFAKSALNLFQKLSSFPSAPNPIKEQYYQDTIDHLTEAFLAIKALLFDSEYAIDPSYPANPLVPPIQDNQVLIKLSNNRAALVLERTNNAINNIDQAILLSSENDKLSGQLVFIRFDLVSARDALVAGFNSPNYQ
ncbi:hypothetical protein [Neobacillus sp. LXY-4]|uniref:hypothetical protein n=1 Tax=Neobacillus sp. LXY-4 TaxID=3379826 RepID=UPI003EE07B5A